MKLALLLVACSPLIAALAILVGCLSAIGFFIGAFIIPFTGLPKPRRKAEEPSTTTHNMAVPSEYQFSIVQQDNTNSLGLN